jgi:hypothetical protein
MFVLTDGHLDVSNAMLEEIKSYQIELFSDLGLHFRYNDIEFTFINLFTNREILIVE